MLSLQHSLAGQRWVDMSSEQMKYGDNLQYFSKIWPGLFQ